LVRGSPVDVVADTMSSNHMWYLTDFLKYNNYKNHIINNKSDKNKILNLRMAARHCQWRLN
jgi:hypothetical protein